MNSNSTYLFNYKLPKGKFFAQWGIFFSIVYIFIFLLFSVMAVTSTLAAIKYDLRIFIPAVFCYFVVFLFGPYVIIINRYYNFALTTNNILIMKSIINMLPHTYKIDAAKIHSIDLNNIISGDLHSENVLKKTSASVMLDGLKHKNNYNFKSSTKSYHLIFKNENGKIIGRFNHITGNTLEVRKDLKLLIELNPGIIISEDLLNTFDANFRNVLLEYFSGKALRVTRNL